MDSAVGLAVGLAEELVPVSLEPLLPERGSGPVLELGPGPELVPVR